MEHKNLFYYAGSRREVYAALERHYARDTKITGWPQVAAGVLFGIAFTEGVTDGFGWFLLGIGAFAQATNHFADNSNRNWAMHVIGPEHRTDDETRGCHVHTETIRRATRRAEAVNERDHP